MVKSNNPVLLAREMPVSVRKSDKEDMGEYIETRAWGWVYKIEMKKTRLCVFLTSLALYLQFSSLSMFLFSLAKDDFSAEASVSPEAWYCHYGGCTHPSDVPRLPVKFGGCRGTRYAEKLSIRSFAGYGMVNTIPRQVGWSLP